MTTGNFQGLDPCVHCGFCLPACPTFLATGDEADSPRGRIVLMRELERGELAADDPALRQHLDACLGCRGCEPVCPSGVRYGEGLETARELIAERAGIGFKARAILTVFRHRWLWSPLFRMARAFRSSGLNRMLQATRPHFGSPANRAVPSAPSAQAVKSAKSVLLFTGCVMDRLFGHVHDATRRTLAANGFRVVSGILPHCCGALHLHAGDRAGAAALARNNVEALVDAVDFIAVNSAGCGALLKHYGQLLQTEKARTFAGKVRDVSELLARAGPREGGALALRVAYDAPCHLQHAQRVHAEPLRVLAAVPGLEVQLLNGFDKCCGSAGIYSLLEPALSREVLRAKIDAIASADPIPDYIATGNPGCLMQIGAGLSAARLQTRAVHPVELLDASYARAGYYDPV